MDNPIYGKAHIFEGEGLCYLKPGTPGRPESCECKTNPKVVAVPAKDLMYGPVIPEENYSPDPVYHYHCAKAPVNYTSATTHRKIRDEVSR